MAEKKVNSEQATKPQNSKRKKIIIIAAIVVVLAALIVTFITVIWPLMQYNKAKDLREQGKYDEAYAIFEELGDYKDCPELLLEMRYDKANDLKKAGKYEEACTMFEELGDYQDSKTKLSELHYDKATEWMEAGEYLKACEMFEALGDFKDSAALYDQSFATNEKKLIADAKVGDVITFGSYEQDNDLDNGAEAIEWVVLDRQGDKVLLFSQYCLYSMKYNNMYIPTTWSNSFMRGWLNTDFFTTAFTLDEKKMVSIETHSTPDNLRSDNPEYHTIGGPDTKDLVFLLCGEEVEQYFPDQESRRAYSTEYAKQMGVYTDEEYSWWWTRTPGEYQHFSTIVRTNGLVQYTGGYLCSKNGGVRPAVWVSVAE